MPALIEWFALEIRAPEPWFGFFATPDANAIEPSLRHRVGNIRRFALIIRFNAIEAAQERLSHML